MKKNFVACVEEKRLVSSLFKSFEYEKIGDLIFNNEINVNVIDGIGNDVVTRLLKAKQYDLVLEVMKKRNWNVNHQNEEGNTFGHILAQDDSAMAVKIMEQLTKKKNYLPNIKNNKGQTAMDIALSNHYLCTAFKILEDKRFDNIDIAKELYVQYLEGTTGLYKYYAIGYNHSVYGDLNYHQSKKRILLNNIENTATKIHLKSEYGIFKKFVKDFILLIKCIYNLTIGFVFNIIKNIVKKTIKLFKLIK